MVYKSVILVILDGWGIAPHWGGNAITQARTPFINLLSRQPTSVLEASGSAVGLPGHERGNSEVGHLNLGAGRVIKEDVTRINEAIADGSFYNNEVLLEAMRKAKEKQKRLHLMGIITKTAIHGLTDHAIAILNIAKQQGLSDVVFHVFTDGRDSAPHDGLSEVMRLEKACSDIGIGKIVTVTGRYYAMDRDHHWDRIQKTWEAIVLGKGISAKTSRTAISQAYSEGVGDEFIEPTVIQDDQSSYTGIKDGEIAVFWNFRSDRARQLTIAITDPNFNEFQREKYIKLGMFVSLTPYGAEYGIDGVTTAFSPPEVKNCLAEVISKTGAKQFHIAETEKYAHVTYFFNGGKEKAFDGEDRPLVPSPHVLTYDKAPAMSAVEITNQLVKAIKSGNYRFLIANFANGDMVAHTGNFQASLLAVETIDAQLRRITEACQQTQSVLIITSDHGNVEEMVNPTSGEASTEHSTNPVPCYIILPDGDANLRKQGVLADVAPTILQLLDIDKPVEMSGTSLLLRSSDSETIK